MISNSREYKEFLEYCKEERDARRNWPERPMSPSTRELFEKNVDYATREKLEEREAQK